MKRKRKEEEEGETVYTLLFFLSFSLFEIIEGGD
jgi:hypothetical protein